MSEDSSSQSFIPHTSVAEERNELVAAEMRSEDRAGFSGDQQRRSDRRNLDPQSTMGIELFSFLVLLLRGVGAEPEDGGLTSAEAISELAESLNIGADILGGAFTSVRSGSASAEDTAYNISSSLSRSGFDYSSVNFSRAEAAVAKYADSGNPILEVIASVESRGNYNIMYNGTAQGATYNLTGRTVNEVLELQRQVLASGGKGTAAGKGQIIRETLKGLRDKFAARGEDIGNQLFDEDMQDRLMLELLNEKGYQDFLAGNKSELAMMHDASKIWAAIPEDMGGESYYKGVGDNEARMEPEVMLVALRQARESYQQTGRQLAFNDGGVVQPASSAPNPSAQFDGEGGVDQVALAAAADIPADDGDPDRTLTMPGVGGNRNA